MKQKYARIGEVPDAPNPSNWRKNATVGPEGAGGGNPPPQGAGSVANAPSQGPEGAGGGNPPPSVARR